MEREAGAYNVQLDKEGAVTAIPRILQQYDRSCSKRFLDHQFSFADCRPRADKVYRIGLAADARCRAAMGCR